MTESLVGYKHIMSLQDTDIPRNFQITGVLVILHRGDGTRNTVRFTENLTNVVTKIKEIFRFGKVESLPSEFKINIEAPNLSKHQVLNLASSLGRQFAEHLGYKYPIDYSKQYEFRFKLKLEYSHISSNVNEYVEMCGMYTNDKDFALTTLSKLDDIRRNPVPILLLPDNGP